MPDFTISPIAFVKNNRGEAVDDNWGSVISEISLSDDMPEEVFDGLDGFSHLEIIFVFDRVHKDKIVHESSHPRGNEDYPRVGIFAQRKKARPNLIGATIVELIRVEQRSIFVRRLDAIDGTPVIDIKPVMLEFLPEGEVRQPEWSIDLMKDYWK